MRVSFITAIFIGFFSSVVFATADSDFRSIDQLSRKLDQLNKSKQTCSDCAETDQYSCFDFLEKMRTDDFSHTMVTLRDGASGCQSATSVPGTEKKFSNAADLQEQFSEMYPELGTVNHNQIKSCTTGKSEPDSASRYKISKFYYYMKKFNDSATRAVEEISAINSVLGDKAPQNCIAKGTLPEAYNRCVELNSKCAAGESKLAAIAKTSAEEEKLYLALKKDIQTLDNGCLAHAKEYDLHAKEVSREKPTLTLCQQGVGTNDFAKVCSTYNIEEKLKIPQCKLAKENLEIQMLSLEDQNPWFASKNYEKLRKSQSVEASIKGYMLNNKKELNKKINEFQDAGLCLNGFQDAKKCNISEIRKLLSLTGEIPKIANKDPKSIAASIYLNVNSCVETKNEFNAETVKELWGAAGDVAMILVTGYISAGYKAAILAKNAANATKFTQAMLALNAGYAGIGYYEAAKACSDQKIEITAQAAGKECPGPESNLSHAEKDHSRCMMAKAGAVISSIPLGISLASVGMKSVWERQAARAATEDINVASRNASAELTVNRKLTPKQQDAVLAAHNVGVGQKGKNGGPAGIGNYTPAQLREKTKILKDAGFSQAEIRKLMENGIVGHPALQELNISPMRGQEVSIPRSSGARTNGIISNLSEGRARVDFIDADGLSKSKTVDVSELGVPLRSTTIRNPIGSTQHEVGQEVSIPRSSGARSNGTITYISDGKATVQFVEDGLAKHKVVDLSELGVAVRAPVARPGEQFIPKVVQDKGLLPREVVSLRNGDKAKVGDFFRDSTGRVFTILETEIKGKKTYQVFYRSNSQSLFRLLPARNKLPSIAGYEKGMSENALTAPPELQAYLAKKLKDSADQTMTTVEAEQLEGIIPVHTSILDYEAYRNSAEYIGEKVVKVDQLINPTPRPLSNAIRRTFPKPQDVKIKPELQPDFSTAERSYQITSPLSGEVKATVYRSKDGTLEYTVMRDEQNRIWFGDIGYSNSPLTKHGIRSNTVESREMMMPLWEEQPQIPIGYITDHANPNNPNYISAWPYIKEMPEVKRWYQENRLEIPK
jgi:hypothetical protein